MLRSFKDKDTERVWQRQPARKLDQGTQRMALRKLSFLTLPMRWVISGSLLETGWRN